MSDWRTDAVEAGAHALNENGAQPGSGLHSWRCEYPDRYGPCRCVAETAAAVVDAAAPIIRADERKRLFASVRGEAMTGRSSWSVECLRARVTALPAVEVDFDPDPHGKPIVRQAVLLADVLALLEVSE